MCGIIGLICANREKHVNQALVDALTVLQHRGQDAAGIVTSYKGRLNLRKENGTVAEVFTQDTIVNLRGRMGIGHVRYPTAGGSNAAEAQPLYTNSPYGIALAHNGNLTNTDELRVRMKREHRHINTDSDSELMLNVFAKQLQKREDLDRDLCADDIFESVREMMEQCKGAYAGVILINQIGIVAFRDPHGIRPLCFGTKQTEHGVDFAVASESVAIDALDPSFVLARDVEPGETIFMAHNGDFYSKFTHPRVIFSPCLFEYVYFARPDSIIDGVQVYEARAQMGVKLAEKILRLYPDHDIDTMIPIPETSRTAALECASILNRPYREGFIKNRYIARTFIMPGQETRKKTVRLKLNSVKSEFRGKVVLLVDDSIVRGTTCMELIQMARDAGAKKVYFASAAPPVRYSNVYGIDIPTRNELVAHERTEQEVRAVLGVDMVVYNDLDDIIEAVRSLNPTKLQHFDASCFDGKYVTSEVTAEYLQSVESSRGNGRSGASTKVPVKPTVLPSAVITTVTPVHALDEMKPCDEGVFFDEEEKSVFGIALQLRPGVSTNTNTKVGLSSSSSRSTSSNSNSSHASTHTRNPVFNLEKAMNSYCRTPSPEIPVISVINSTHIHSSGTHTFAAHCSNNGRHSSHHNHGHSSNKGMELDAHQTYTGANVANKPIKRSESDARDIHLRYTATCEAIHNAPRSPKH